MKIKKLLIFCIYLLLSLPSKSEEVCELKVENVNTDKIDKLSTQVSIIANKSNDNNVILEAATTYLLSITGRTDFLEKEANQFINSLIPLCEGTTLESKFRSKACTKLSALNGKMAQKLQMSGVTNGKNAYNYIKIALSLDPNNSEAVIGHAMAVVGISQQNFLLKKVAESKLGITVIEEAKLAKANLERLNLKNHPLYSRIVDIL